MRADTHVRTSLAALALSLLLIVLEVWVPDAGRLRFRGDPRSWPTARLEYLQFPKTWTASAGRGWSETVFSYPLLLAGTLAGSLLCCLLSFRSARALSGLTEAFVSAQRAATRDGREQSGQTTLSIDRSRLRLGREARYREVVLQPVTGFVAVSLGIWTAATVIAAKLDPEWLRPILPPPALVSQALQHYGDAFFWATLRTGNNLAQGCSLGFGVGLSLGFILAGSRWLREATEWHIVVVAATPPLVLAEVLKPFVNWVPLAVPSGELGFKIGISMTTWTTT